MSISTQNISDVQSKFILLPLFQIKTQHTMYIFNYMMYITQYTMYITQKLNFLPSPIACHIFLQFNLSVDNKNSKRAKS
jgi:hypothetical protein